MASAGECLAEAMHAKLGDAGLPSDLHVLFDDGRVVVASRSDSVRKAECGSASGSPKALLEAAARDSLPRVLQEIAHHVKGVLR